MENSSIARRDDKHHIVGLLADLDYDDLADIAAALGRLLADGDGNGADLALLAGCHAIAAEAPPTWTGATLPPPPPMPGVVLPERADGRLYARAGFTRTPAIRAILDPIEGASYGGIVPFAGLTVAGIRALRSLLPRTVTADRQNEAPTFAQLTALGRRFPAARFGGYRVMEARWDERIMLDSVVVPETDAAALLVALQALGGEPDEWHELVEAGTAYRRAWWD
jgi:hypothetical protein